MTPEEHQNELSNERAAEKEYSTAMQKRAAVPLRTHGPRNGYWTGTGDVSRRVPRTGELVGRVALSHQHEDLDGGSDFYIGDGHLELAGVEVFSWAAPVACAFFRGLSHHDLCREVAVIRTFGREGKRISDFFDEAVVLNPPTEPFKRRTLLIASAPMKPTLPGKRPPSTTPAAGTPDPASLGQAPRPDLETTPTLVATTKSAVRAGNLLLARVSAPRTERLSSVLSTLQPDQYEQVSTPGSENRFLEGHPGTGKTIIAAHRAAYLVSEAIPWDHRPPGKVLLIGPSRQYSEHVRDIIHSLAPGNDSVSVVDLPFLLANPVGLNAEALSGPLARTWQDVSKELADLATDAVDRIERNRSHYPNVQDALRGAWDVLRKNGESKRLTADPDWIHYLRRLPLLHEAMDTRAHLPLLAFLVWSIRPHKVLQGVGHVIVDEAQDVHALEWALLRDINLIGSWTILGDLNQRRSHLTEFGWDRIADIVGVRLSESPVVRLDRGYRSTRPIMQYANRLLPRTDRELESLQADGPEPTVVRVRELAAAAEAQALQLAQRHQHGTVAIITTDPHPVCQQLLRAGWRKTASSPRVWERGASRVTVSHPDESRGLEFDAVVVVEPSTFQVNTGRHCQLYTALTRANRELVVLHRQQLPDALRVR